VTGTYVAPNDEMAWFIQGSLEFIDATDIDVTFFSIKRTQTSNVTEDFQIALNGKTYARRKARAIQDEGIQDQSRGPGRSARESSGSRRRSRATTTGWPV
jgi:hypothetical protein